MKKLQSSSGARSYISVAILGLTSFTFYEILIYLYPSVYWYDAHVRLGLRDQILLGHWLPLLQAVIVFISNISLDLVVLRSFLAMVAVASVTSMFFLAKRLFSDTTALIAGMFLAFNMMFVALAIVPYPEVIFVGLGLISLVLLDEPVFSRRFYFGVLAINLACLTRYEGWILSAIFIIEGGLKLFSKLNCRSAIWPAIKLALLLNLGPLLWLFIGFPDSGTVFDRLKSIVAFEVMTSTPQLQSHLLSRLNFQHIQQFSSQFFSLLSWQFHPEFLILAAIGLLFALFNSASKLPHIRILVFLLLDWALLAFLQPWGFGNLRQPFILEVFLTLYAAFGLEQSLWWLLHRFSTLIYRGKILQWILPVTMIASIILSASLARSSYKFVVETSREPDFIIPSKVGNWLKIRLTLSDGILLLTDDLFQPYALAAYAQVPFERVLDDRLDPQLIQDSLDKVLVVYIIELYRSQENLSQPEKNLLADLKTGNIPSKRILVGQTYVWIVQANELTRLSIKHTQSDYDTIAEPFLVLQKNMILSQEIIRTSYAE